MPTQNASRIGYIVGTPGANQAAARDITSGTATDSATSNNAYAVQWYRSTGRGGGVYRYTRTFAHFDTSGITDTLSACDLKVTGYSLTSADVIGIKSTAFGGDGGTALASGDMDSVDFGTAYSAENSSWSTGVNTLTLTAAALADIKNNDDFTIALVEYDSDYLDTDTANMVIQAGIKFDTAYLVLDYTVAAASGPANLTSYNSIAKANITNINGITMANITTLSGIS
jgi:hypothetical protein